MTMISMVVYRGSGGEAGRKLFPRVEWAVLLSVKST